ncbi:MAG: GDSL family lipase [Sphingomonadaceae bacterium]|nr:GDSL family lipase [Sphingomonadaceae bacterium]
MMRVIALLALGCAVPAAAAGRWHPPAAPHAPVSYEAENAALPPPQPGAARVVFIGDSITFGWKKYEPQRFADGTWIDRGIAAQTSTQIAARLDADALALKPTVVHILAGACDIEKGDAFVPEETVATVAAMAGRARTAGAKVVIGSVLPAIDYPWRSGVMPAPKVAALNQALKAMADANHYVFADYYAVLVGPDGGMRAGLARDGVHPLAVGYRLMDPVADAAIAAAQAN